MHDERMTAARFALAWGVVLLVVLGLDAFWLGLIARDFYAREMGSLMSPTVRAVPAVLFYLLYPLAFVYLVLFRAPSGLGEVLLRSAVFGLAAYGTYDLTCMAVVTDWPITLSLVDWAWGGAAAMLAGSAAYAATWGRR
jgi:uncharacterized membrane protein